MTANGRKVALVTGASRGIGAKIAEKLVREGYSLVLTARTEDALRDLAKRVPSVESLCVPTDLGEKGAAALLVRSAVERFGRLDLIVANAGAAKHGDILSRTDVDWQDGFGVKFFGHVSLIREAWPALEKVRGSIVFIAGMASKTPTAGYPIGAAVNSALLALTKSLADLGREKGVRVNAINPGQIRTDRFAQRLAQMMNAEGLTADAAERRIVKLTGGTRVGEPDDIASLVSFLAGEAGSYFHGAVLDMDGGMTKGL